MKKKFSSSWSSSRKPGKQRKYRSQAPLHRKQKLVHGHVSKDLRTKYKRRAVSIIKGDKVRIMRGKFKKHEGKVERVDIKDSLIYVAGAEHTRRDGTKKLVQIHPSNVIVLDLNLDDKLRQKSLEAKNG